MQTVSEATRRIMAREWLRELRQSLDAPRTLPPGGTSERLIERATSALEQAEGCMHKSEQSRSPYWEAQWLDLADIQLELANYCVRVVLGPTASAGEG